MRFYLCTFFIARLLNIYMYYSYCVLGEAILSGCTEILFLPVSRKTDGIHVKRFCNPNFGCDTANASTLKFSAKSSLPPLSLSFSLSLSLSLFHPLVTAHGNEEPDASVHFSLSYGPPAINLPPFEIEGDRERNLFADLLFIVAHCPVPRTGSRFARSARSHARFRSLSRPLASSRIRRSRAAPRRAGA